MQVVERRKRVAYLPVVDVLHAQAHAPDHSRPESVHIVHAERAHQRELLRSEALAACSRDERRAELEGAAEHLNQAKHPKEIVVPAVEEKQSQWLIRARSRWRDALE
jgi:hypothetical protein